ncbi:MAG: glutamine-hydrolyzing carbamoyl-phosphate synthase small subunit [Ruminococcaceae bacterium]|nr:glutamine-hydrolyzing carbamoyl-phosphate synthase small subunit [Oscillospiraceae bacterium]
MDRIYLILENGTVFEGRSFGASGETVGELVFTTGVIGYTETLTDPCNCGQIVAQTFPLIGNYGIIPEEIGASSPKLKAYIVREYCEEPSNFRCEGDIVTFMRNNNIIGICDIDTRALTRIIRENGIMNAKISKTPECDLNELKNYKVTDAVKQTTCSEKTVYNAANATGSVVVYDLGSVGNAVKELNALGLNVTVVPAFTSAEDVLALSPDGIMLSEGPGDPTENTSIIAEVKKLLESGKAMFGVGLGHQIIALAGGCETFKLKYGHRGANHPVMNTETSKTHITSQNHGYAVDAQKLPSNVKMIYRNLNDNTCAGIAFTDKPVFSVQFKAETLAGPNDTGFLFKIFAENIKKAMVR